MTKVYFLSEYQYCRKQATVELIMQKLKNKSNSYITYCYINYKKNYTLSLILVEILIAGIFFKVVLVLSYIVAKVKDKI